MILTIIAFVLEALTTFIFGWIYFELRKNNNPDNANGAGMKLTAFLIISQLIVIAEILLTYFNIV